MKRMQRRIGMGQLILASFLLSAPAAAESRVGPGGVSEPVSNEAVETEVAESPGDYLGMTVRIRGRVTEVVGANGIRLRARSPRSNGELFVINATGAPLPVEAGDEVTVIGPIRALVVEDVEADYEIDLEDEIYAAHFGQPVLIAEAMTDF